MKITLVYLFLLTDKVIVSMCLPEQEIRALFHTFSTVKVCLTPCLLTNAWHLGLNIYSKQEKVNYLPQTVFEGHKGNKDETELPLGEEELNVSSEVPLGQIYSSNPILPL